MNSKRLCHIVCAAPGSQLNFDRDDNDFVIAADGGYKYCKDAGLVPDLFVGDFDSLPEDEFDSGSCECIKLPTAKDDTDTMACIKMALDRGFRRFVLHAALGGDLGHELANLQTLAYLRSRGANGELRGISQLVRMIVPEDGEVSVHAEPDTRVSVFAFGSDARGVSEHGLQWELDDAELTQAYPLGVSNKATSDLLTFSVREGALLVVLG